MTRCVDEEALVRLLDGELTENDAERTRQHLRECAVCAARSKELARVIDTLKGALPDTNVEGAIDAMMAQLPGAVADASLTKARSPRRAWLAGGIAIALAAAAFAVVPSMHHEGEMTARGAPIGESLARAVGVTVSRANPRAPIVNGSRVTPEDAYAVAYRNVRKEPAYLLLFAIDRAQSVHWIAPAYLDAKTNPESASLSPSNLDVTLPNAMQLDSPAEGAMRFIAVLTPAPLHVRDVEALRGEELSTGALRARWPGADVRELATVDVSVSP